MKKKLHFLCVLFVAVLLMPWQLKAQTWSEDFNSISSGVPEGWSVEGSVSSSYNWQSTGYTSYPDVSSVEWEGTNGLYRNCYYGGSSTTAILKSKKFSLKGQASSMLTFNYLIDDRCYDYYQGELNVYISKDGGATYNDSNKVFSCAQNVTSWAEAEISLAKYAEEENLCIVFVSKSDSYGYCGSYHVLDNVAVGPAPTCAKAKDLSVKELTLKDVTLTWKLVEGKGAAAENYKITILNAAKEVVYTTTTAIAPVEGVYTYKCELAGEKEFDYATYTYTIQGICKAGEDEAAVAENNFTVKCAQPKNLKVDGIELDEATISWEIDATTGIVSSDFYLYINDTVLVAGPFDVADGVYSRYISYEDELLFPGNTYKVSVKTSCSTTAQSEVVSTTFATKCDVYDLENLVLTEITETALVPCWTIVGGKYFGTYDGSYVELYEGTTLITPAINFASNNLEVFVVCMNSTKDKGFTYGVAEDATLKGYVELGKVEIPTTYKKDIVTINTAGVANTFGADTEKVLVIKADNSLSVYSIDIHEKPCCPRMERVTATALSATEVEVSWTGSATSYDVILTDTLTKSTKTVNVTTNPCTITGLNAQTVYKVEVKANCDGCTDPSGLSIATFVKTKCAVAEVATFVESFENSALPECWSASETNKWQTKDYFSYYEDLAQKAYDGEYCLYMPAYNSTPTYIVSQGFNVETVGQYEGSFAVYRSDKGSYYDYTDPVLGNEVVRVLVNNRPDTVGAKEVAFINTCYKFAPVEKSTGWYTYEFAIPEFTGTVYLIIEGKAAAKKIYLDKIEVKVAPKCRKVSGIKLGEPTTTSVPLTWTAVEGQNKWLVSYEIKAGGEVVKSVVDTVANATTFTIDGLASSTSYTITGTIKADCGDENGQSEAVAFDLAFATECDAVSTFPYTEGFEGATFPPTCWIVENVAGSASSSFKWTTTTTSGMYVDGSKAAYYQWASKTSKSILVTPQFNFADNTDYKVELYAYRGTDNSSYEGEGIGVYVSETASVTENSKLLAFIPRRTTDSNEKVAAVTTAGMYQYAFEFNTSEVSGKYVIFEAITNYGGKQSIDNVWIGLKPDVEPIKEFNVNNVTVNSATVTVADEATTAFDIVYGAPGFDPTTVAEENIITIVGKVGELTGLTANTDYQIYVRARNVEKGKVSEWSAKSVTIHTLCNAEVVTADAQFVENFDAFEVDAKAFGCWSMTGSTSTLKIKNSFEYTVRYQDANDGYNWKDSLAIYTPVSGERMLFSDNKSDNIWLLRGFELEAGKNYSISAMVRDCYSSGEATISFAVGTTTDIAAATRVLDNQVITKFAAEWERAVGYFSVETAGTYYVAFNTKGYNVLVDDVTVKVEEVIPPVVNITEITGESATFDLIAAGADYYEMYYATDEFNANEVASSAVKRVETEPYTLTGLSGNTTYYYAFRSVKGETKTAWTKVASFKTQCGALALPFVQDFETADCWTVDGQYRAVTSPARNGNSWNFGSGSAVKIISPMVNGNLANCEGSVWAINNYYGENNYATLIIGVMTDPLDETTYKQVDTVVVTGSVFTESYQPSGDAMTEYTFSLASLAGTEYANAKYVVFEVASYTNVFVDDFMVREIANVTPTIPAAPVFSPMPAEGEKYTGNVNVTLTCATEGASILYAVNSAVNLASVVYDGAPIALGVGTHEVQAVSIFLDEFGNYIPNEEEEPYMSEIVTVTYIVESGESVDVENTELVAMVYAKAGVVYVDAAVGSMVEVFTVQGQCIYSSETNAQLTTIDALNAEVVLVKVNGQVVKVAVK